MGYVIFFIGLLIAMFVTYIIYSYQLDNWDRMTIPARIISFVLAMFTWCFVAQLFYWFIL